MKNKCRKALVLWAVCVLTAILAVPVRYVAANPGSGGPLTAGLEESMDAMFGNVQLPGAVSRDLNTLYEKHRDEVVAITEEDPGLIVEIVQIGIELMPGIREARRNGGRLSMARSTYNRGQALLDRYAAAGSPDLASDVGRVKSLLERRTREVGPDRLLLDLSR